ncbi:MAG: L,D-transpeptidase [Pseudorhodoplanes sp.]|nr:hypothetical protein [Pseudorhodoplanes sp.]MBW7949036.1 L,D-transpeptidase [Pseudorhodoplanes sp.]MCL4711553.1 L,D-transpeptidase [Pseudorhodoplanes sp.]MCQ3942575.1 hypothetical protein [Alphaproteobacteria bacterium]GIK81169.1 MAG: L,D-transpeptidase [Alphaproteobacteria bacterium]
MTALRIVLAAAFLLGLAVWADRAQAEIEIRVDKAEQRMAVTVNGLFMHSWAVSTGLGGGPRTGLYRPQRMERKWFSRKYNMAPMPYSIFFHEGYAIHGTIHVKNLGRRASKGCVRLHPANAAILFDLVKQHGMGNTRIVVESGVAQAPRRSRIADSAGSPRIR